MFAPGLRDPDPVETIRAGVERLAVEDRGGWTPGMLAERLRDLHGALEGLRREVLRLTVAWHEAGGWQPDGALSPVGWLAHHVDEPRPDAARTVAAARLLATSEVVRDAFSAGSLPTPHLRVLARVTARYPADVVDDHLPLLVEWAERLPVVDYTRLLRRWSAHVDGAGARPPGNARQGLRFSPTIGGTVVDGFLSDPDATLVTAALDDVAPPDPAGGPEPPRSLARRRADALVALAQRHLSASGTRPTTTVDVVVDLQTIAGDGSDPTAFAPGERRDVDGRPLARHALERLLCDTAVGRIVVDGPGDVLDVGRRRRLVTLAQRRALAARDRGCVFTGCDRPPSWCDAHHLVPWTRGGPTDLDNLVLLCSRHHTLVHRDGWTLRRLATGSYETRPPTPTGPDPP